MVRKLDVEALNTDLNSVRSLLARRTVESDPIGHLQFSSRAREIERQLEELHETPETKASLAVYFAGGPVQGSRGIRADFAGEAVSILQDLIAKQFANMELGAMAGFGPVPLRGNSDMLITDLARGSVGVILEEAESNLSLTQSELSVAVRKVAEDIQQTSQTDATAFEELLGQVDTRYFASLTQIFRLLDESRATVRLVEGEQDLELDAQAVHRGRVRTESATTSDEDDVRFSGRLFLLPEARKFELRLLGSEETIHGNVSREFASANLAQVQADNVVNRDWAVAMRVRTITRPNRPPQFTYTLTRLVRQLTRLSPRN